MITCLGQIFWGLLLVIIDININHFDLLPDFLGYLLVALGAGGLIGVSSQFRNARNLCWLLVPMSLLSHVVRDYLGLLFGLLHMVLNCGMMWFLLGGIMKVAASSNRPDLADKASTRRVVYVFLICLATLLGFLGYANRDLAMLGAILVVIPMLILVIMVLHLIWQVRNAVRLNNP